MSLNQSVDGRTLPQSKDFASDGQIDFIKFELLALISIENPECP